MSGSLQALGGDKYRVRVYAGLDQTGRQRQRSRTFRHRGDARSLRRKANRIAAELEVEIDSGRATAGTVAEAVQAWLEHKEATGASPTTMRSNRSIAKGIVAGIGHLQLGNLNARHIDAFYGRLRQENIGTPKRPRYRTESTIHHYHRILAAILRQAERWEMVDRVATRNATTPKKEAKRLSVPSAATLLALMEGCEPSLRFAAALAAATGLRRGELVGLRWSDLDGNTLHVRRSIVELPGGRLVEKRTKTGREREVVVGPETLAAIAAHRVWLEQQAKAAGGRLAKDGPMLAAIAASPSGKVPHRPDWLTKAWRNRCDALGVRVRLHDLRHWHATTLIDQGIPVSTVAGRLGHAQTSTTLNVYSHAVRETDVLAAAAIERALNPT